MSSRNEYSTVRPTQIFPQSPISILTSISTFVVHHLSTPLLISTAYGIQCLFHSAWLGGYTHSSRHFHALASWLEVPQIVHEPRDVIRGVQRRSTAAFESSGSWMLLQQLPHMNTSRQISQGVSHVPRIRGSSAVAMPAYMNIFDRLTTPVGGLNPDFELITLDLLRMALNDSLVLPSDRNCKWSLLVENCGKNETSPPNEVCPGLFRSTTTWKPGDVPASRYLKS